MNNVSLMSTAILMFLSVNLMADKQDTLGTPIRLEIDTTLCPGLTFVDPNGTFNQAGIFIDTFTVGTCDSIRTLNLSYFEAITINRVICESDYIPGSYTGTTIDENGCEQMETLTVIPSAPDIVSNVTLCEGETFITPEGIVIDSTGEYIFEEINENGCSSFHIFNVTFIAVIPGTVSDIAICPGEFFMWGGSTYSQPGSYVIAGFGCAENDILNLSFLPDEDCFFSSTSQSNESRFSLYPNPANDFLVLEGFGSSQEEQRVQVVDQRGVIVYSQLINQSQNKLNISQLESGIYLLQILDSFQNMQVIKFMKK